MANGSDDSLSQLQVYFQRVLIVEDDEALQFSLQAALQPWCKEIRVTSSITNALDTIINWHPELMLLDYKLADGTAVELLSTVSKQSPFPATIAISAYAQPTETFELAHLGVRVFLQKPIMLADLEAALRKVISDKPDLTPAIRSAVGTTGLKDMENQVRQTMLEEALARTTGSRRGAARVLQVSRQFIQHVINKYR